MQYVNLLSMSSLMLPNLHLPWDFWILFFWPVRHLSPSQHPQPQSRNARTSVGNGTLKSPDLIHSTRYPIPNIYRIALQLPTLYQLGLMGWISRFIRIPMLRRWRPQRFYSKVAHEMDVGRRFLLRKVLRQRRCQNDTHGPLVSLISGVNLAI